MKILFITPTFEYPANSGPTLRIENSIKALGKIADVHLLLRSKNASFLKEQHKGFIFNYCSNFTAAPSESTFWLVKKIANRIKRYFNYEINILNKIDARYIINYSKKNDIKLVWLGFGNVSFNLIYHLKKIEPHLKIVCDTDSVWSRFILRSLPFEQVTRKKRKILKNGHKKETEEKEFVHLCDIITAVSKVDAEYYKSLTENKSKIKIFSNVIDYEKYQNRVPPPKDFKKPCIYLAGTFWKDSPMEKATRWFLENIFPIIKKNIPEIHFYIVGLNSNIILSNITESNITITGRIDSVLPFLCNSDVAIVPLGFESGTRFKILEAGACGIPIVSTTLGAEGIPVTDGYDILIADEANEFAECIIKIIKDNKLSTKLSKNCKDLVKNNYSINSLMEEATTIINYLAAKND
ncbi:MAG: hypothetical protein STSR0008_12170 [Ignavibacterium sp.]